MIRIFALQETESAKRENARYISIDMKIIARKEKGFLKDVDVQQRYAGAVWYTTDGAVSGTAAYQ